MTIAITKIVTTAVFIDPSFRRLLVETNGSDRVT